MGANLCFGVSTGTVSRVPRGMFPVCSFLPKERKGGQTSRVSVVHGADACAFSPPLSVHGADVNVLCSLAIAFASSQTRVLRAVNASLRQQLFMHQISNHSGLRRQNELRPRLSTLNGAVYQCSASGSGAGRMHGAEQSRMH